MTGNAFDSNGSDNVTGTITVADTTTTSFDNFAEIVTHSVSDYNAGSATDSTSTVGWYDSGYDWFWTVRISNHSCCKKLRNHKMGVALCALSSSTTGCAVAAPSEAGRLPLPGTHRRKCL